MLCPDVTTLYKYFTVNNRTLDAVRTGAFWFANPSSFNDPFDCALTIAHDGLEESVRHAVRVAIRDGLLDAGTVPADGYRASPRDAVAYREFRERLEWLFNNVGILCITEVPDDLLMWSHYANSHRGFCLGFERTEQNILGRQARPVVYQDDYPRLTAANFDKKTNPNSADVLWLTKSTHWAYEREWRLIEPEGNKLCHLDVRVTTVMCGMRMPREDRARLREALAENPTVRFLEATRSDTSFRLNMRSFP